MPLKSIIVAAAQNGVIGRDNRLLWHIPEDLKYFKQITHGKPVIMGRKTYESILGQLGKPLPGRLNIVITRQKDYSAADGVIITHNLEAAVSVASQSNIDEIFCIGGAEIYRQALPEFDRVYLTVIEQGFDGDSYFPFLGSDWHCVKSIGQKEAHPLSYHFEVWEKK